MKIEQNISAIDTEIIRENIYIFRGRKVMLDRDLAVLYGVPTMRLNEAVRRNIKRFPNDFMFALNKEEMTNWISQIAISNQRLKQSLRKPPLAFTEQGIAMLSSVLRNDRAIQVNIQIIRVFTRLREMVSMYKELRDKVSQMEKENVTNFTKVFDILKLLTTEEEKPKEKIGFNTGT